MKDIRGANFLEKPLNNKDFQKAQAGLKNRWKFLASCFAITIAFPLNLIAFISGGFLGFVIFDTHKNSSALSFLAITIYSATLILVVVRGYEITSVAFICALIFIFTILNIFKASSLTFATFLLVLSITLGGFGTALTALAVALTSSYCGIIGKFIALLIAGMTAVLLPVAVRIMLPELGAIEVIVTSIATSTVTFIGAIIARQAMRGSPKFAGIREKAVFWAATGGTSFYEVDLTDACFHGADLPHTDFRKAILTRASFKDVTGLELARLQGTILEQPKVRKLLVNRRGCNEDYTGANLSGANLQGADLTGAILVEAQALDADFTGATLTNACIQGWNINKNTRFKDVECQRIYLKCSRKGDRIILSEPKPDSGEFQPGEFEKWIGELQNTVDLIFREGLNWRAFMFSLAQTAIEHEGLDLSRYDIARKDENIVFAKIGLFPGADNAAIHQTFQSKYEYAEKAIEAKYQLVLQAKDSELERLRTFAESNQQIIRELMSIAVGTGRQILVQGESHKVYLLNHSGGEVEIMESKKETKVSGDLVGGDKGDKITIGGDNMAITSSSITLGDLNGQVINTIQQLKDVQADGSDELAKILTALQEAIQSEAKLPENKKKEALEAVQTIAEEAKKPSGERVIKLCSMAMNALTGITTAVTDASKLAEVFKIYLPTLSRLLGI
jgi:uncharacterized protein YjbI with pentapeptide repeats